MESALILYVADVVHGLNVVTYAAIVTIFISLCLHAATPGNREKELRCAKYLLVAIFLSILLPSEETILALAN